MAKRARDIKHFNSAVTKKPRFEQKESLNLTSVWLFMGYGENSEGNVITLFDPKSTPMAKRILRRIEVIINGKWADEKMPSILYYLSNAKDVSNRLKTLEKMERELLAIPKPDKENWAHLRMIRAEMKFELTSIPEWLDEFSPKELGTWKRLVNNQGIPNEPLIFRDYNRFF